MRWFILPLAWIAPPLTLTVIASRSGYLRQVIPTDYLGSVLASPNAEKIGYLIIVVILLTILDRRILSVVKSHERLVAVIEENARIMAGQVAHQTSRMEEIRNYFQQIARFMGALVRGHGKE